MRPRRLSRLRVRRQASDPARRRSGCSALRSVGGLLRVQAALEAQVAALQSQLTAAAAAAVALAAQVRRRDTRISV